MKRHHKVFIAIPFDAATRDQYRRICESKKIKDKYPNVTWVIGTEQIGPSPELSKVATFKAQNRDLHEQFTHQIRDSDVLIADLSHNNPNVHVELGIALNQNKNNLRVSGRSISELAFDIRNQDVRTYKNEQQLTEFITKYLDTFFEIKDLPLSDTAGDLYCKEELNSPVTIDGRAKSNRQKDLNVLCGTCLGFRMRDGAVEVEFEILSANDPTDWFGIFFRGDTSQPVGNYRAQTLGSYLAYVRQNRLTEIVEFPGPQRVDGPAQISPTKQTIHSLRLEVENNEAQVYVDNTLVLTSRKLWRQAPGSVLLAAYGSEVKVYSAHMVCRDTIEWD